MRWNKNNTLSNLHEESRYYRRFHHTILSIFIAGYTALVILQASLFSDVSKVPSDLKSQLGWFIVIVIILFIVIPVLITWLIFHYHVVQGKIQNNILNLQKDMGIPDIYRVDKKYENFDGKKFIEQLFTGFGHLVFVTLLWLVDITNIIVFIIIYNVVT